MSSLTITDTSPDNCPVPPKSTASCSRVGETKTTTSSHADETKTTSIYFPPLCWKIIVDFLPMWRSLHRKRLRQCFEITEKKYK